MGHTVRRGSGAGWRSTWKSRGLEARSSRERPGGASPHAVAEKAQCARVTSHGPPLGKATGTREAFLEVVAEMLKNKKRDLTRTLADHGNRVPGQ